MELATTNADGSPFGVGGCSPFRLSRELLEPTVGADGYYDYILTPYAPPAATTGKLRNVNLLFESFATLGVEDAGRQLVHLVRSQLGQFRTVWGIKHLPQEGFHSWELYFYKTGRQRKDLSVPLLVDILQPIFPINARESWPLPWHMFSIEFSPANLGGEPLDEIHVYIDYRSYQLREGMLELENLYSFHDPRQQIFEILDRIQKSGHIRPESADLGQLIPPELRRCHRVSVANKRGNDAVYFSRVDVRQLAFFFDRHQWPASFSQFVADHAGLLDHLYFDVGIDYVTTSDSLRFLKSGIYGSF